MTSSPGPTNVMHASEMACDAPLVTRACSGGVFAEAAFDGVEVLEGVEVEVEG